jgi:Flp pilus assembly protein TadG
MTRRSNAGFRKRTARPGAAAVEMAFVLPVFVLILLGMIEVGRGIMVSELLGNAAREGARQAIVEGSTNTQVIDTARNFVAQTTGCAAGDVTVNITISNSAAGGQISNSQSGDLITVNVRLPFSKVCYLPPSYLSNVTLSSSAVMRRE